MNEILNQKFGVEVEMYNISRSKAARTPASSGTRPCLICGWCFAARKPAAT